MRIIKNNHVIFLLISVIIIFISSYLLNINTNSPNTDNNAEQDSLKSNVSKRLEENPSGRQWLFELLKDPATNRIPYGIRERERRFVNTLPKRSNLLAKSPNEKILTWKQSGPFNVGGRSWGLGIDVNNENIILAGGETGGVWRSTDGGQSWIKTTSPSQNHEITYLVQDTRPGKTHLWYYAPGEYRSKIEKSGNGIYKSTDNGKSWNHLGTTDPGIPQSSVKKLENVSKLVINANNLAEDEILAATYGYPIRDPGTEGSIKRSIDGGESWTPVLGTGNPHSRNADIAFAQKSNVYYAALSYGTGDEHSVDAGLWRSTDGVNWTNITPSIWKARHGRTVIAVAPSNENVVYFLRGGITGHDFLKYTYLFGDGSGNGGIWEDRTNSITQNERIRNFQSYWGNFLMLKVKPDDENTVFMGGLHLFRSEDGFLTNNYIDILNIDCHVDQQDMFFSPSDPNTAFISNDGGIYKTHDINKDYIDWISLNNGYFTSQFYSVALDHSTPGDKTIIGGMQDNGTVFTNNDDKEKPWVYIGGGDGGFAAISKNREYYYTSWQDGMIIRQKIDENGNSNHDTGRETRVHPRGSYPVHFIHPFILNPTNTNMMFFPGGYYIYRNNDLTEIPKLSYDTDVNWDRLKNTHVENAIYALEMSSNPPNRLYYASRIPGKGGIFRLDNAHVGDPEPVSIMSFDFPYATCSSIAVDRMNADNVMLVYSSYEEPSIFYSEDGGDSWTDISGNLEEFPDGTGSGPGVLWAEIINYGGHKFYFVGTTCGLYSTREIAGLSTVWMQEAPDIIGNVIISMIDSRDSDGRIAIATYANGIYSADLSEILKPEDFFTPNEFILYENYPNPFNSSTTIRYDLDKSLKVKLSVYSITGREVKVVYSGDKTAGNHYATWNGYDNQGRKVSSGVYIYRLSAGGISKSGKMVLVK